MHHGLSRASSISAPLHQTRPSSGLTVPPAASQALGTSPLCAFCPTVVVVCLKASVPTPPTRSPVSEGPSETPQAFPRQRVTDCFICHRLRLANSFAPGVLKSDSFAESVTCAIQVRVPHSILEHLWGKDVPQAATGSGLAGRGGRCTLARLLLVLETQERASRPFFRWGKPRCPRVRCRGRGCRSRLSPRAESHALPSPFPPCI